VLPDQTAALRPIEVETVQDQWAVIKRGLQVGDQVVLEGQNQLRPGAKVARRPSVAGQEPPAGNETSTGQPQPKARGKRGGAKP
jgi:membrane fusion protein, multidrug efflux system